MATDPRLVLVCNSHIDPVWLWKWEEGLAETLATFRAAAELCETFDGFVFCHNEALLYMWVEQHEPELFEHLRDLVRRGRWHIMGGWLLQPDCNLPSGESLVRQALVGQRFFLDRFGVEPTVAVNLDSFGHSRGLVQILAKAGYTGYLFCRPDRTFLDLPADDFMWIGYDGSTIAAHRAADHYNSELGKAREKAERWLLGHRGDGRPGLLLWGVGNHGGGPSRADLRALGDLIAGGRDRPICHGRPEDYFADLSTSGVALPAHRGDLNPWGVGCYTSMATVKRQHRQLEQALYATEKMLASAALQRLLAYPSGDLRDALEALLFCEFHDILTGSSASEVEEQALHRLGAGLDLVARLRARAFFALLDGQPPASDGEFPIFVHNHHPFAVEDTVVCEFQPPEPNFDRTVFYRPELTDASGAIVPAQTEKESCNIQIDQRKRVVFRARLSPSSTTRFSCRLSPGARGAERGARPLSGSLIHRTPTAEIVIDSATGLLARYQVDGVDHLGPRACRPLVMKDTADPWGMKVRAFRDVIGEFTLMSRAAAAAFAAVSGERLAPVRVIEEGPVRTVVEALFEYRRSALCLRYNLPSQGSEIEVDARVAWMEKDRMLKLSLPTPFIDGEVNGQVACGVERASRRGEELLAHKWVSIASADGSRALTVINDATYGYDFDAGELRISLVRSPAYAGHPVDDVRPIVRQDRFEPRIDQGEHRFRFWLNAGAGIERLGAVWREATVRNDGLMALCAFPRGAGTPPAPGIVLEDDVVQLEAMKIAEDGHRLILRLFEPTGRARATTVLIPPLGLRFNVGLGAFELRTLAVDLETGAVVHTDLLERDIVST